MANKEKETYIGSLISADFEEGTMEFEIDTEFFVQAGKYALVPLEEYEKTQHQKELIEKLKFTLEKFLRVTKKYEVGNYSENIYDCYQEAESILNETK